MIFLYINLQMANALTEMINEKHKTCSGIIYDGITILNWITSDDLVTFNTNKKLYPKKMRKWNEDSVLYTVNSYGFRNNFEFDDNLKHQDNLVVLGCSNSFGIGVPADNIYCKIVADKLKLNLVNLAVPGGSMDSAARVSYFWLKKINPVMVILQIPERSRREFLIENGPSPKGSWDSKWLKYFFKYADESDNEFNKLKNILLIKTFMNENTHFFSFPWHKSFYVNHIDLGRDLNHVGIETHKYVAQRVLDELERNIY